MDTNKRLDLLEKKIDLIMDTLTVRLEFQKFKNEIKVLKIRFRKLPMQSPLRQEMLDNIEKLMQHQADLETELNATH